MSTVPGHGAWEDAGLAERGVNDLLDVDSDDSEPVASDPSAPEEYDPDEPRPDLDGGADEADVVEQASAVQADEREDYP